METEGVGFTEAVERLAAMAGVPLPAVTPDAARHEQRRKTLYDVMELAAKFFADTLASRNGAKARGYLGDRAISPAVQLQFRIGYAPARALRAEGASRLARHSGRGHGRSRLAGRRRRYSRCRMIASATA